MHSFNWAADKIYNITVCIRTAPKRLKKNMHFWDGLYFGSAFLVYCQVAPSVSMGSCGEHDTCDSSVKLCPALNKISFKPFLRNNDKWRFLNKSTCTYLGRCDNKQVSTGNKYFSSPSKGLKIGRHIYLQCRLTPSLTRLLCASWATVYRTTPVPHRPWLTAQILHLAAILNV